MACQPLADSAFGPLIGENCRALDFTLYFEETILRTGISTLFLVLAIPRLIFLSWRSRCVERNRLFVAKILTEAMIVASIIYLIAGLVLCFLSPLEHLRTVRPSSLIAVYLLFSILFETAYVRTLWLTESNLAPAATVSLSLKTVLLVIEGRGKKGSLLCQHKEYSKDKLSGFFSRSLFLWLLELLRLGFGEVLSVEDLYPLEDAMRSATLEREFLEPWTKASNKGKSGSLFLALAKALKWHILYPVFPLLCHIGFTFAQPLMLTRVLKYLADTTLVDTNDGYGLIGAYAVVYIGIGVSTGWYQYLLHRFTTMTRGTLIALVYRKTLKISIATVDDSDALTLMSTDVERIVQGLFGLYECWSTAIQVAIAAWLLQREIGISFFFPIVLCFACAFIALSLTVIGGKKQIPWLDAIKDRLALTSTMIKGMKGVKMLGLSESLLGMITKSRSVEINAAFQYRLFMCAVIVTAFIPQAFAPVVSFGAALTGMNGESSLASGKIFTSLLLLRLLTQPLTELFQSVPLLIAAVGCLRRIEAFACSEEHVDLRELSVRPNSTDSSVVNRPLSSGIPDLETRAFRLDGASFGWTTRDDPTPIVKNAYLDIHFSQLTIIIGPAGSGKSTLLKGLLGETPMFMGKVETYERQIAFCDQTPWLTNGTVQENILGMSAWNHPWYKTVIHACALDEDLASFPGGDQARLGSNGINLSGGQKQRVALARAVYSRCRVVILDDVLSGLDRITDTLLFQRLLSYDGLLRREGICIVLATHSIHHLPNANWIVSLGEDGEISEQGTFADLRSRDGYVSKLDLAYKAPNPFLSGAAGGNEKASTLDYSLGADCGTDQLNPAPRSRQMGDLSVYKYYFRASGLGNIVFYGGLQLLWAFFASFPTIWLEWWSTDMTAEMPTHSNSYYFGFYTAFQAGFIIVLGMICIQVLLRMQVVSGTKLHTVLATSVISAQMSFFSMTDSGVILNIFSQDLQVLDYELPFALQNTVSCALTTIAQAILLLPASYWLALSFPFLILAFYFIQRFYLRTSRQLRFLDLEAKSPLYTSFLESLSGLATIRALGWEQGCTEANWRKLDFSQRPFYLLSCLQRWLALVLDLLVAALAVILVCLATQLRDAGGPGFTGVALFNLASLAQTMTLTVTTWTVTEVAMGAVARIKNFQDDTPDETLPGEIDQPPPEWPMHGSVEFRNISAQYKDGGEKAVDGLSIKIQPGEKIAVCGRTGSGKSTLISILFRMLDPMEGSIHIDGVDLVSIPRNIVRARLNAVPQESFLVAGSIRENLDMNGVATDEEIMEALRSVKLAQITENMGGVDANLESDLLSHGQKQMFCLARAILHRSSIVVLDEATSNMDVETDGLMQSLIRTAFRGRTVIAIVHRLETVLEFDKIAVLDHGRLVEFESPSELLNRDSALTYDATN
ncbi:putative ABC transporter [Thozetella sp. PMI_491]|nr:putative ABC transporter [Thozetella sp. PMI_491]